MFTSVLVANRGEIAVRVIRTLHRMGIRAVVACSIPDRTSLAVRMADAHVLLEGYSATETYLDIDAVIAAAQSAGCEAIHPGYGFLSERAEFAERCAAEGIVFVGPPPAVLAGMGDKAEARQFATANGVPVVPGWDGSDDDATLVREAARIGFPVMLKARGGGGGRGMREVNEASELAEAIMSARREAEAAFGDPGLLLEKLVRRAHHVEVQVLADAHGNVIHLGERDCSVQRRHQKLVEETPSPVVDEDLRSDLTGAALRLARAIGYVNAGTFEFLVGEPAEDGRRPFYFLEVNPRLQVEHGVTELVTGIDLVELQLRVAAGEPLPLAQQDVRFEGHAIEFRLNAEDPWDGFKPSTGRLREGFFGFRGRLDAGFEAGDVVPSQYDSLLAKLILHAPSRADSLALAAECLTEQPRIGLRNNVQLHRAVLANPVFAAGDASVDWLEPNLDALLAAGRASNAELAAAAVGLLAPADFATSGEPARRTSGWLGAGVSTTWLDDGTRTVPVHLRTEDERSGCVTVGEACLSFRANERGTLIGDERFRVRRFDPREVEVERAPGGLARLLRVVPPPPLPKRAQAGSEGATVIAAPLAGTIAEVRVAPGDEVEEGQLLAVLEAMKMEHRLNAPTAGTVKAVNVQARDVVREGDVLIELG